MRLLCLSLPKKGAPRFVCLFFCFFGLNSFVQVVELLVAAGAPVTVVVEHVSALEAAIRAHHMRCAQILIGAKAGIEMGAQDQPSEDSDALKWIEKALHCLEEAEEQMQQVLLQTNYCNFFFSSSFRGRRKRRN